jgi:hypothetical protein
VSPEDEQAPLARQTLRVDPDSVKRAIEEFEREIPKLAETAEAELLRRGEEYAPLRSYVQMSFRLAVVEARLALLGGRLREALQILSRRQVEGL